MSTGSPESDAAAAFARERRRQALAKLASRARRRDDVAVMLPFEDVVAALGRSGERHLGLQSIALESVIGTVDRRKGEFDRRFRPASSRPRRRWESIAVARRRGRSMPPIDVYRIGTLHFVIDGHHRVSVARAHGDTHIDAHVREVQTSVPLTDELMLRDLLLTRHEREFDERVPLAAAARARIQLSEAWRYEQLSKHVESWAFRASQAEGRLLSRAAAAEAWFHEEYIRSRMPSTSSASAARGQRPHASSASRCCAISCSARAAGATTSSSGCSTRSAVRRAGRPTRLCSGSSERCADALAATMAAPAEQAAQRSAADPRYSPGDRQAIAITSGTRRRSRARRRKTAHVLP
jgi:hypothetical protein